MSDISQDSDGRQESSRRIPWLAALSSAMLPGLGQVYNGQINRALWCFLIFAMFSIPGITLAAIYLPDRAMLPALICSVLIGAGTWIFSILDAWRQARRSVDFRCPPWQTSGLYVALFIVCNLILLPLSLHFVRQHQVQAFHIPSDSMSPTLLPGDFLFADMRYNCPTCAVEVTRGDIVIFVYPNNRNRYHVKRVLGMPGDRIVIQENGVARIASDSTENEEHRENASKQPGGQRGLVPPGHVFVVGDNLEHSLDSRSYGPVPLSDIAGRARQVWFSRSDEGVRWRRIGMELT